MVSRQTVTLANSIVGVSVLAMPFCFKQCGIILATLMLMFGAILTRMVCYFLLKAGTITRRRNYEMLAWHTFGQGGKFMVEISIIGFLIGTLVAFFVVIGDLGPQIISEIFDIENNFSLRNIIMTGLCLFVALPLGLLRNIDSLSSVSTASVLFYVFLVCKILSEGMGPLFSGSYLDRVDYWRPAGVLQCIPIFSMALSCQTQIFGIYESLPEPSMHKMNEIVKQAVTICTIFYFCIGFFGYIAFSHLSFGGNILMTFSPSWTTQLIKTCFLMSIVFSVPLVVFPCRASLHSLIFRRVHMHHSLHDISTNYIPDGKLKFLTILIISSTLIVGILIPNIELVLGLVGSTTGTVICIIFPSIMFIRVTSKQTTERLLAQVIFCTGVVMMVVSTYATLYAVEQAQTQVDPLPDQMRVTEIIKSIRNEEKKTNIDSPKIIDKVDFEADFQKNFEKKDDASKKIVLSMSSTTTTTKKPQQIDQINMIEVVDKEKIKVKDSENSRAEPDPVIQNQQQIMNNKLDQNFNEPIKKSEQAKAKEIQDSVPNVNVINFPNNEQQVPIDSQKLGDKKDNLQPVQPPQAKVNLNEQINLVQQQDEQKIIKQPVPVDIPNKIETKVEEIPQQIQSQNEPQVKGEQEALIVEGEIKEVAEGKDVANLLKKLEEHEQNQKKFLEEQRQVLAELKEHHAQDVKKQKADDEKDISVLDADQGAKVNNVEKNLKQDQPSADKIEVIKQEKLIEKLSENIEKEQQNAKLIEKIEEGLEKEIKEIESEPKSENKVKIQDPVQPNFPQVPAVEKLQKKIIPDDPSIIAAPIETFNSIKSEPIKSKSAGEGFSGNNGIIPPPNGKRILKPIPFQQISKSNQIPVQSSSSSTPGIINKAPPNPIDDDAVGKAKDINSDGQVKISSEKSVKKIDRDI